MSLVEVTNNVEVTDLGWNNIKEQMRLAENSFTEIGVHKGETRQPKPGELEPLSDMVIVAAANEFGAPKKNIPPRAFIRTSFDENRREVDRLVESEYDKILAGKSNVKKSLEIIGEFMETKTKQKIVDLKQPPNRPRTIARKGSNNPLMDTGQLRGGIRHVETING